MFLLTRIHCIKQKSFVKFILANRKIINISLIIAFENESQSEFHATKSEVVVDKKQGGEMKWTASAGAGVNLPLTGWSGEK